MLAAFVSDHRQVVGRRFLAYPVIATLTMLICFWSVPISLGLYLLLLPLYVIPGRVERAAPGHPSFMRDGTGRMHRGRAIVAAGRVLGLLAGGWAAFRPELLFLHRTAHDAFPAAAGAAPVALTSGAFHGVAHPTRGTAAVYQLPGAGRVLRLMDFQTSNGPDVRVFLIKAADANDEAAVTGAGYVEVGKLRGSRGDQNYPLPTSLDLAQYHAVTIWCKRFQVNFATAPLKAPARAPGAAATASR